MIAEVLRRLDAKTWRYADADQHAFGVIDQRIAEVARTADGFHTYTSLIRDLDFQLPNVNNGQPFRIIDWTRENTGIVADFLGRLNVDSYRRGGFFASSLVVGALPDRFRGRIPGQHYFNLAEEVGALRGNSTPVLMDQFWREQVRLTRAWYQQQVPEPAGCGPFSA
jgi:hypothetical protein